MSVHSAKETTVECEWPSRPVVKLLSAFQGVDPEEGEATETFLRTEAQTILDHLKLSEIYKLGNVSLRQIGKRCANGRLYKAKNPCIALVPKGHSGCFLYRWGCVAEECISLPEEDHALAFCQTRSELWSKGTVEIVCIDLDAVQLYHMEHFTINDGCEIWKGRQTVQPVIDPAPSEPSQFLMENVDAQAIAEAKLLSILAFDRTHKFFEDHLPLDTGALNVPNTGARRFLTLICAAHLKIKAKLSGFDRKKSCDCELEHGDILILDETSGAWTISYELGLEGEWIVYHPEGVGLEDPELARRNMVGTGMSDSRCIPYNVPKTALKPQVSLTLLKHSVRTCLLEHKVTAPWMKSVDLKTPPEIVVSRQCSIRTAQFDPTVFAFLDGEASAVISEEGNGLRLVPVRNLVGSIWWLWPQSTAHLTSATGAPMRFVIFAGQFKPLKVLPEKLPEPWGTLVCRRVASPLHLSNVPSQEELEEAGDSQIALMPAVVCLLEGAPLDPYIFAWRVSVDEEGPISNDRVILVPLKLSEKDPGEEAPQGWDSLEASFAPTEAKVGGEAVRVGDIVFTEGRHVYMLEGTWLIGEAAEDILPAREAEDVSVEESSIEKLSVATAPVPASTSGSGRSLLARSPSALSPSAFSPTGLTESVEEESVEEEDEAEGRGDSVNASNLGLPSRVASSDEDLAGAANEEPEQSHNLPTSPAPPVSTTSSGVTTRKKRRVENEAAQMRAKASENPS